MRTFKQIKFKKCLILGKHGYHSKIRQIPKDVIVKTKKKHNKDVGILFKPEPIPNYGAVNNSKMFIKFKVSKQNWMTCDGFPRQI